MKGSPDSARRYESHVPSVALGLIFVMGAALRLVHLEADPVYPLWAGYITDEGRWTELARQFAIFRSLEPTDLALVHLVLAPLHQLASIGSFVVFGVSLTTARLVSAAFGLATMVGSCICFKRTLSLEATVFVAWTLSVQADLVFLSRVAIPEMGALFLELLAFAVLVSHPFDRRRALLSGVATAAALGMKATTAPVVLLLLATAVSIHEPGGPTRLRHRLSAYLAGLLGPAVAVLAIVLVGTRILNLEPGPVLESLSEFVRLSDPYTVIRRLSYTEAAPTLYALLLPFWALGGLVVVAGIRVPPSVRPLYIGSAVWAIGWIVTAAGMAYFPQRYLAHVVVPLALNLGAGITILQSGDGDDVGARLAHSVRSLRRGRLWLAKFWFAIPVAAVTAPVALLPLGGAVSSSLSVRMGLVLGIGCITGLLWPRDLGGRVSLVLALGPAAFVPTWLTIQRLHGGVVTFWGEGELVAATVGLVLLGAFILNASWLKKGRRRQAQSYCLSYFVLMALPWLSESLPVVLAPSFTIRDASAVIVEHVDPTSRVATGRASSLFLNTQLRYEEGLHRTPPTEYVVTAFYPIDRSKEHLYEVVAIREIRLGAAYLARGGPVQPRMWIYRLTRPRPMTTGDSRPEAEGP